MAVSAIDHILFIIDNCQVTGELLTAKICTGFLPDLVAKDPSSQDLSVVVKASEADLVWDRPTIDAYEQSFVDPPIGFWREMLQLVGIGRSAKKTNRRQSIVVQAA